MKKLEVPDEVAKEIAAYLAIRTENRPVVETARVRASVLFMGALKAGDVRVADGAR